jgi:D-alanyl-lipoteichoic acid acyltransferase DltB (MBOAT superfamily)
MLFNSHAFLFVFLPAVLAAFHIGRLASRRVALGLVSIFSLVFYAMWDVRYLWLLVPSLVVNYLLGEILARTRSRAWLVIGVTANLAVIGWFKYSAFFYTVATGGAPPDFMRGIVLPLGISFITFQKVAYLVDIWRGHPKAQSFDRFAFFVLFFPQLIAGPIVLFRNIDRQIARGRHDGFLLRASTHFGLILLAIGLFKKVVIADSMATFADAVFRYAELPNAPLGFLDAWIGAATYSLQLYFDFSGYSDMAIGMARMFGFRLPTNFNSPYQATSIIDFWRRWHITLSSFFRDYVYIPLGGNRKGLAMQAFFILVVFFLTGLWHGAGWTFVVWGSVHGVLVLTNHLWQRLTPYRMPRMLGWAMTLASVVVLWVVFRAPSLAIASKVLAAMIWPRPLTAGAIAYLGVPKITYLWPVLIWIIAVTGPNSRTIAEWLRKGRFGVTPAIADRWWLPAAVTGAALYVAVSSIGHVPSKFIYFNF